MTDMTSMIALCSYHTCYNFFTLGRKKKFCSQICADRDGKRNWKIRNNQKMRDAENKRRAKRYREDKKFREEAKQRSSKNYHEKTIEEKRLIKRVKLSKEYYRNYAANRSRNDMSFRITNSLRARVRAAIKNKRGKKSFKTMQLIGCSIAELRQHLEKQFTEGMTWENYGSWHIDHIKPCASFNLLKEEEQLECFNFKNLQPLWAKDNLRKGNNENV